MIIFDSLFPRTRDALEFSASDVYLPAGSAFKIRSVSAIIIVILSSSSFAASDGRIERDQNDDEDIDLPRTAY